MNRVSPSQLKLLLDLLSENGVLSNGKVVYMTTNKQNFWKSIALQLNAVEGGVYKSIWKWCKTWADWKNKTKKKANILLQRKRYNIEHTTPRLNNLELRLLKIINYPIDGRNDALELEMVGHKMCESDTTQNDLQFLKEDYNNLNNREGFTYNSTDICINKSDSNLCESADTFDVSGDYKDNGECSSSADTKEKLKIKGKRHKRKKLSLEQCKISTTMAIEKERVQQKSEELRLRALELKLKGEELRLKEMEMNKINHLTNIEEEKVKYLKEISLSLKELVKKNGGGSLHLNNL